MAYLAATLWEVRTTGSDANGGGFSALSGTGVATGATDYSQQNAAQIAYTDLVIGSTTTLLTSAAHPFVAAQVGNVICVISGSGFTVQRAQIVSVAGVTATMDRSMGTALSTGGTGNLGGAVATLAVALNNATVNSNTVYVQAGTYVQTSPLVIQASIGITGYRATRGDMLSGVIVSIATSSQILWTPSTGSKTQVRFTNLSMVSTATTKADCIGFTGSGIYTLTLDYVTMNGFSNGIDVPVLCDGINLFNCAFLNMAGYGIVVSLQTPGFFQCVVDTCFFYGCGTGGMHLVSSSSVDSMFSVMNSVFVSCGIGIVADALFGRLGVSRSTFAYIGTNGITAATASSLGAVFSQLIAGCIFYSCGAYGVGATGAASIAKGHYTIVGCAFGANVTGNVNTAFIDAPSQSITLTDVPFNGNAASGDMSLNTRLGGGALCRGTGIPGPFQGGLTTGFADVGGVQSAATGGGATVSGSIG